MAGKLTQRVPPPGKPGATPSLVGETPEPPVHICYHAPVLFRLLINFALLSFVVGCGGASATGPLNVRLGTERQTAVAELERRDYCRPAGPSLEVENYARCDSPGLQLGESWVVARYNENGELDQLTRYERQPDERRATERWEALVAGGRQAFGRESKQARARLSELAEPPNGTVAWVAWFSADATTITALYLVRPSAQSEPNVVEVVRWAITSE